MKPPHTQNNEYALFLQICNWNRVMVINFLCDSSSPAHNNSFIHWQYHEGCKPKWYCSIYNSTCKYPYAILSSIWKQIFENTPCTLKLKMPLNSSAISEIALLSRGNLYLKRVSTVYLSEVSNKSDLKKWLRFVAWNVKCREGVNEGSLLSNRATFPLTNSMLII